MDPGNEKTKKNPLNVIQVTDSFMPTNSCLEHSRRYLQPIQSPFFWLLAGRIQ